MKKYLLIIPVLLFSLMSFSQGTQGIKFENGTWKDILAKAQQTNKPVFLEIYTLWSIPCIKMDKEILSLKAIGRIYNANFVCYHIDAEEGEGVGIAKQYEVRMKSMHPLFFNFDSKSGLWSLPDVGGDAFPTYLFLKADGTLFYKVKGRMNAKDFIAASKTALAEMKDSKSINVFENEYTQKMDNPKFLLAYMNKRSKLGLSNALLLNEYLKLLPEKARVSDAILKFYEEEQENIQVNSIAFENLLKHKSVFYKKFGDYTYSMLYEGILNTIPEAAKSKDEQLLAKVLSVYDLLPSQFVAFYTLRARIYMQYYELSGDSVNYLKSAINLCNNELMKISEDSITQIDLRNSKLLAHVIDSRQYDMKDSAELDWLRTFFAHKERNMVGANLNSIAWEVFGKVLDKNQLQDALRWSERSLELQPHHSSYLDTSANLLYKLGQKEEAIAKEEEAIRYVPKENISGRKNYEETLQKMKAGEKTGI